MLWCRLIEIPRSFNEFILAKLLNLTNLIYMDKFKVKWVNNTKMWRPLLFELQEWNLIICSRQTSCIKNQVSSIEWTWQTLQLSLCEYLHKSFFILYHPLSLLKTPKEEAMEKRSIGWSLMMVVSFDDWSTQYNWQRAVVTQLTGFTMIYKIHKMFIKPKQFRLVSTRLIQSVARRNNSCLTTGNLCRNVILRLHLLTIIHRNLNYSISLRSFISGELSRKTKKDPDGFYHHVLHV
jgi:hypothetical protein